MLKKRLSCVLVAAAICSIPSTVTPARTGEGGGYAATIDAFLTEEKRMVETLAGLSPVVETYLQNFTSDKDLGEVPESDRYFLTKLTPGKEVGKSMKTPEAFLKRLKDTVTSVYGVRWKGLDILSDMFVIDDQGITRDKYDFEFVRKEFLGDVRCLVFDVKLKPRAAKNGFSGRIWVEDEGNHIVRFNGVKGRREMTQVFIHTDSWRQNMNGSWLPVYAYSEESDVNIFGGALKVIPPAGKLRFRAQSQFWAYNPRGPQYEDERTSLTVESETIRDLRADPDASNSPVLGARAWQRQAEDNILERLQKAGLVAPPNEVDAILKTVITNLEITNSVNVVPSIRARVLMTSPMETFTIGHTIVVSRGLIDVLPDEASLAMALSHEMAHILLGHKLDTKYAFHDRMLFEDYQAISRLNLKRSDKEEAAADIKAAELLRNSPYANKLDSAGLFLKAVERRAPNLPNLIRPHMGNRIAIGDRVLRMNALAGDAPQLEMTSVEQIAALPLGGRIRVDPWNGTIELIKGKPVALLGPREKMPFEIAPLFPYLTRVTKSAAAPEARREASK